MRIITILLICIFALVGASQAEYDDYCYGVAFKLAQDPTSLKLGEIDGLKTCLADLQRAGVVEQKQAAQKRPVICPEPDKKTFCPVCPTVSAAKICPAWLVEKQAKEQEARQVKREEEGERKRLKPHIPGF